MMYELTNKLPSYEDAVALWMEKKDSEDKTHRLLAEVVFEDIQERHMDRFANEYPEWLL